MIHRMHILLIIGLCAGLLYGAEEIGEKGPASGMMEIEEQKSKGASFSYRDVDVPNHITLELADGQIKLSQREWERLFSASKTLHDMVSEIGNVGSSLPLTGVTKETFLILLNILKDSNISEDLNQLRFEQQLDLWGCANLLDMPSFLSPLNTIIAHKFTENKYNLLTQFMTKPAGTIALLTSYGIDIASHDIGYIMIESYLNHLWIPKFKECKTDVDVYPIALSLDGKMIASASGNIVHIWDVQKGTELRTIKHSADVYSLTWSPDGTKIASVGGNTVHIWDVHNGKELYKLDHSRPAFSLAWSPDGKMIASASGNIVHIVNSQDGIELRKLVHSSSDFVKTLAWSPDGTKIASAVGNTVHIVNSQDGIELRKLVHSSSDFVRTLAWSPDGTKIASAADNTVHIWDMHNGKELYKLGHSGPAFSLAWSPDGKMIASSTGIIRIWNVQNATSIFTLSNASQRPSFSVAWSSDGTKIASGSRDGTLRIWDIQPLFFAQRVTLVDALILIATIQNPAWPQSEQAQELISSRPWNTSFRKKIEKNKGTITISDIFDLIIQYEEEKEQKSR